MQTAWVGVTQSVALRLAWSPPSPHIAISGEKEHVDRPAPETVIATAIAPEVIAPSSAVKDIITVPATELVLPQAAH
jgi:hypothetical protein